MMDNLETPEIPKEKNMANGGYGEPGKPGERGEPGVRGGGSGGYGGYGGAGGRGSSNNGNGDNKSLAVQWIPTVVMILAVFGFWWASADPKARLDKIENIQLENRKELNEAITSLRKEGVANFLTLREHNDLAARIKTEIENVERTEAMNHSQSLTKAQFEAWKTERDLYLSSIVKRIDYIRDELLTVLKADTVSEGSKLDSYIKTAEKTHDAIQHEIDAVHNNVNKVYDKFSTDLRALSERIDRQDTPLGKRVDGIDFRLNSLFERLNKEGPRR